MIVCLGSLRFTYCDLGLDYFLLSMKGLEYKKIHSQKQSAHWDVDVTAQVIQCWSSSWLKCHF